jgi:hypothetical protein
MEMAMVMAVEVVVAEAEEAMAAEADCGIDDATWQRMVAEADVARKAVALVVRIATQELRAWDVHVVRSPYVYGLPGVSAGGPGFEAKPVVRLWWRRDVQVESNVTVVCPGGSASGSGGGGGDTEQIAELGGGNGTRAVISQVMEVLDFSQVIQNRLHLAGDAGVGPLHRFVTAVAAAKVALAMAEMAFAVAMELDASPEAVAVEVSHFQRTKKALATAKKALAQQRRRTGEKANKRKSDAAAKKALKAKKRKDNRCITLYSGSSSGSSSGVEGHQG